MARSKRPSVVVDHQPLASVPTVEAKQDIVMADENTENNANVSESKIVQHDSERLIRLFLSNDTISMIRELVHVVLQVPHFLSF